MKILVGMAILFVLVQSAAMSVYAFPLASTKVSRQLPT